jgi:L-alanine-DL-glutamate epimerase-like enolase superfamily enzyme
MKITGLEIREVPFSLKYPSAVAYATQSQAVNIFLKMETSEGLDGWGCSAPDESVTGETPMSVSRFLKETVRPLILGRDPLEREVLMKEIRDAEGSQNPAATAAVSISLFDLWGKIMGMPVYSLLGGSARAFPASYTISLLPLETALEQTRQALARGFRILKVKLGEGPELDAHRLEEIRRPAGPQILFRLDANQAYSALETLEFLRMINMENIQFLEQPTPAKELRALKYVTDRSPIPIMADECVLDANDARRIVSEKIAHLVNVKLMKCGGLDEALRIDEICAKGGVGTMLGCMDESALSISAAMHLACAMKSLRYIDLDGHFDIINDIASSAPIFKNGNLEIPSRPGLGVDIILS